MRIPDNLNILAHIMCRGSGTADELWNSEGAHGDHTQERKGIVEWLFEGIN